MSEPFCFQTPVWYTKCIELNPKRTAEATKNWCANTRKTFVEVPFFQLWNILNIDRLKLVHVTENDDERLPDRSLHDPDIDAFGFQTKTIGRSRTNYVRRFCHICLSFLYDLRSFIFDMPMFADLPASR